MGYLINAARPSSLKIGGTERINQLRSFQVSDTSSYRNGIVTTTGTIVLGTTGHQVVDGGLLLEDYKRDDYQRGTKITFDVTYPSGTTARHPRGLLNVISTVYDPESATISIDVGCDLVMAKLLGDDSVVLPFEEIPLDETTKTFEGVSSSLATAAKLIWQDSQGTIQSKAYFEGDSFGQYQPGAFVSVRGVTALAVQPLAATAAIPDRLELSYQSPVDGKAQDDQGRVDVVTTESNYFIKYPATVFERIKGATVDMKIITAGGVITIPGSRSTSSPSTGCGNTPSPPQYSPSVTVPVPGQERTVQIPAPCSVGYETKSVPQYIPAKRREIRTTTYDGPAAQTSSTLSEVYGPALELNSQYWADKFAYCGSTYANECLPSPCPMYGTYETKLGKQETRYFYGAANEVVKQVTSTYRPRLAAAQPDDWRSGVKKGIAQDFDQTFGENNSNKLYLHQVVVREFSTENNANVQKTTTFTSSTSRGGGIGGNIDAYKGIKTSEVRRSVSSVTSEIRPDSVNAATTSVDTDTTFVEMHGQVGGFVGGAGPYVQKEDTPVPLLYDSKGEVQSAVNRYGDYLARFIEGDARGLTIGEALREQIGTNWTPNMPFRYYDPNSQNLMAFRADACSWGADQNGCIVVLSGIWVADMSGTVTIPDNLVGNAVPILPDPININPTHGDSTGVSDPVAPDNGSYVPGTYLNLPTTGGNGTGATLDIVITAGGIIDTIDLNNGGTGYRDGDRIEVDGALLGSSSAGNVSIRLTVDEDEYVDPTPPTPPVDPDPDVTGDTATNKRFNFFVEVYITAQMLLNPSGENGIRVPPPGPQDIPLAMTLVSYVRGYISQPGAMVALENDGSLPLNGDGTLIVDDALIIVDDEVLFPPTP